MKGLRLSSEAGGNSSNGTLSPRSGFSGLSRKHGCLRMKVLEAGIASNQSGFCFFSPAAGSAFCDSAGVPDSLYGGAPDLYGFVLKIPHGPGD